MTGTCSFYSVLSVDKSASTQEIYESYTKLLELADSFEETRKIQEAYIVLGNKESRRLYDTTTESIDIPQRKESFEAEQSWSFVNQPSFKEFQSRLMQVEEDEFIVCDVTKNAGEKTEEEIANLNHELSGANVGSLCDPTESFFEMDEDSKPARKLPFGIATAPDYIFSKF